jgi:hypothetical protein
MFTGGSDDEAARIAAAAVPGASKSARRIPVMSDPRHPAPARAAAFPGTSTSVPATGDSTWSDPTPSVPAISVSAMSIEDYARAVQVRTEFVDFLLAPARGELAAAA